MSLHALTPDALAAAGASPADAAAISRGVEGVLRTSGGAGAPEVRREGGKRMHAVVPVARALPAPCPVPQPPPPPPPFLQLWRRLSKEVLAPRHPWPVHTLLHAATFAPPAWDEAIAGPPPAWVPTPEGAAATNLGRFLASPAGARLAGGAGVGAAGLAALHSASRADPEAFWPPVLAALGVAWATRPTRVLAPPPTGWGADPDGCAWFPGGRFNIAAVALGPGPGRDDDAPAVAFAAEGDPTSIKTWRLGELRARCATAAAALRAAGVRPGDAVAVVLPLSPSAVAAYLGAVWAGAAVVSVAESLTAGEIALRLAVTRPVAVLTAAAILRGGRALPLYPRVAAAADQAAAGGMAGVPSAATPYPRPRVLVLAQAPDASPSDCEGGPDQWTAAPAAAAVPAPPAVDGVPLAHPSDASWAALVAALPPGAGAATPPFVAPADAATTVSGVLFSSGTTGTPKAIPWSHVTPLRCGVDAWASLDVRARDVLAWPTSLGWMMGPFLVYGALLNSACIALFEGAPTGRPFCAFVGAARVTCLGTVPSLVRAWRAGRAADGLDWGTVRCFGSTGEASAPDDSTWLAARARYAPVLELCGGTELAGGYAAGNLVSPWAPSTFAGPALGADFVLLAGEGEAGEGGQGGGPGKPGSRPPAASHSRHAPGAPPAAGEVALIPPALGMSQALLGGGDHAGAYYAGMPLLPLPPCPAHPGAAAAAATPVRLRRHGDGLARLPGGAYAARGRVDDALNLGGIKVAAVELEAAVLKGQAGGGGGDGAATSGFGGVADLAAVAVPGPGGGPDALVLVVVPASPGGPPLDTAALAAAGTASLRACLSPLFRVDRVVVRPGGLPRTATGKVMRRVLREELKGGGEGGRARL